MWVSQGDGISEGRRGASNDRSVIRHSIGRQSVNPLTLLVGAIGSVVESVAASGEHDSFKSLVHKQVLAAPNANTNDRIRLPYWSPLDVSAPWAVPNKRVHGLRLSLVKGRTCQHRRHECTISVILL